MLFKFLKENEIQKRKAMYLIYTNFYDKKGNFTKKENAMIKGKSYLVYVSRAYFFHEDSLTPFRFFVIT